MEKLNTHQRIGNAVKALRISYGLKQAELARRIDKTPQSLWKLEKGEPVSSATLLKVLDELNVTETLLDLMTNQLVPDANAVKAIKRQSKRIKALQKSKASKVIEGSIASGISKDYIENPKNKPVPLKPEIETTMAIELLSKYPNRFYRVDEQSYRELMETKLDVHDIALITLNQYCISDFDHKIPHMRRNYYVSTLQGAKNTDLTWYVDNYLRDPKRVLNVTLLEDAFRSSDLNLSEYTASLREWFYEIGIFIDGVSYGERNAIVSFKGDDHPVGRRYLNHFEEWLDHQEREVL